MNNKRIDLTRKYQTRKPYKTIYIFTEGEKTEVNYFHEKRKEIEKIIRRKNIRIEIEGKGFNTESLVDYAIEYIEQNRLDDTDECWVVFDKDDFNKTFNSAIIKAEKNNLKVAYSNESFELWFLLHFCYLNTAITRKDYISKLTPYLRGITGDSKMTYEKNAINIYSIIKKNEENAIKYAKKLLKEYSQERSYMKKNPSTTVYLLVESLNHLKESN